MTHLISSEYLARAHSGCTSELNLPFHGISFRLRSDNPRVLDNLRDYYSGLTSANSSDNCQTVYLINSLPDTTGFSWTPVRRRKTSALGLKEAFMDTPEGRWIHKVRTGMVMFQSLTTPMVTGNLQANLPQVVNFINNQFLNHHQRNGYLLGHAAALSTNGNTIAIAASSGGGKSTLMLRALEAAGTRFLSNDRILFKPDGEQVSVLGVPKHPRVNPGTLIHSPRLASLLPEKERIRFAGLPRAELWDIEEKYDVLIPRFFGNDKTDLAGKLTHLVLLDWSLDSSEPTGLSAVDIQQAPEAIDGLRKSPGPFYQDCNGRFPPEQTRAANTYVRNLDGVQVWQLTGSVDFDLAIKQLSAQGLIG